MTKLLEEMKPLVDQTIATLENKKFNQDPIGGKLSKTVSVMSAAYKRHGLILEQAILAKVKSISKYDAWDTKSFFVSNTVSREVTIMLEEIYKNNKYSNLNFEYKDESHSKKKKPHLQVDLLVYNKSSKTLNSYEIKRGNGRHDAGKQRGILRDLLCTESLLKSYGEYYGYEVKKHKSYIIFYYGTGTVGTADKWFKLTGSDLDTHFKHEIYEEIEQVNKYYKNQLFSMLSQ